MIGATVFSALNSPAIEQLFAFALDLGPKSLVLCAAALVLERLLGRRVLARSSVLHACLVGMLLLPAAALVFPTWRVDLRSEAPALAESQPVAWQSNVERPPLAPRSDATLSPFAPRKDAVSRSETRQFARESASEIRLAAASPPAPRAIDWRGAALSGYLIVAAGMLLRLGLSLAAVARLKRSGSPLTADAWTERLEHWRMRLEVTRPVALLATDRIDVPVVVGWRRPAILAPERLAAADRNTIDAVLLHELAHVRRGDYGWNLLLRMAQALYWANPLARLVGRSLARVREQACDDACIHWLGGAENYRATLVELASRLLHRPLAALGMAMARTSRLERRLAQIDASRGRADCQARRAWRYTAMAVIVAAAGVLGALRTGATPVLAEEPAKPKAEPSSEEKRPPAEPAAGAPAESTKPAAALNEEQPADPDKAPAKPAEKDAGEDGAEAPQEPIKVRVEKVRREDFIVQTTQPGTLKPARSMELYARVAGLIVARQVNVGEVVKAGQVLAEINAPELEAELEQARAAAEEAPVAVEQAQGKLDEAMAGLEAAQAQADKAEALATLPGGGSVAKAEFAAAKAEVKQAEAAVAVAKAGLRIAELHLTSVQQALKRVELRARLLQIIAPADGVVVRQAAEAGSYVKVGGEPLFVISATNVLTMETQIPERDALRVALGQHAQVWLDAEQEGKPRDAKVSRVGYVIDPKTRTMSVEIALPNSDGRLRPGMYGKVTIDLETHPGVLTAPMGMLGNHNEKDGKSRCLRVVDDRAVLTEFVADWNDRPVDRVEVKSGLSEGDLVIVGQGLIREGTWPRDGGRVEIVEDDE